MDEITIEYDDLSKTCQYHHSAWTRGYMSRTGPRYCIRPYKGRFGQGYLVHLPTWQSTTYHRIEYWIFK